MTHPPFLIVIDDASTVLAHSNTAKALMDQLLFAGRKNGIQEQPERTETPALHRQHRTLAELDAARGVQ